MPRIPAAPLRRRFGLFSGRAAAVILGALAASVAGAHTFAPIADFTLVQRAELIVVATVGDATAVVQRGAAFTDHELSALRVLKGQAPRALRLRLAGGTLPDGRRIQVSSTPEVRTGERFVLFLELRRDGSWHLVEGQLGAFRIDAVGGRELATRALDRTASAAASTSLTSDGQRWLGARRARRFFRWIDVAANARFVPPADYFVSGAPPTIVAEPFEVITFGGLPARWSNLSPSFARNGTLVGSPDGGVSASSNGAGAWNGVSELSIQVGGGGSNSVNYEDPADEIAGAYDCAAGGTLAFAETGTDGSVFEFEGETFARISQGRIVVQNDIDCFLATDSEAAEELLGHEFGHIIGLDHSGVSQALMWPFIHGDGRGAQLNSDDIAGVEALRYTSSVTLPPPPKPTGLAVAVNGSSATLSWNAGARLRAVDDYLVRVGRSPGASDVFAATTTQTTTQLNNLAPDTYYARVAARNGQGTSAFTADVPFTVGAVGSAPNKPRDLTATVNEDTVTLRWGPAPNGSAPTSYRVEVGTSGGSADFTVREVFGTSLTLQKVPPDEYYARVFGLNAFGTSEATGDEKFEVEPQEPPGAVKQLRPLRFTNQAFPELQWAATAGAAQYELAVQQGGRTVYSRSFEAADQCDAAGNCRVAGNSQSPGPFEDGAFTWSVRGVNVVGAGPETSTGFSVKRRSAARRARLRQPADGATVSESPLLRWSSDERTNALVVMLEHLPTGDTLEFAVPSIRVCLGAKRCSLQIDEPLAVGRWRWSVTSGRSPATVTIPSNERVFTVARGASDR